MWELAARRLALLVPTVLGVATLTFVVLQMMRLAPQEKPRDFRRAIR